MFRHPLGDSRSACQMRRAFESAAILPKEVHRLGAPRETAQARERARGCRRPRAAEGFFRAGEGEVAGGEIRGVMQFEPIKSMASGWFALLTWPC